jgi:hypothetical protein
VAANINLHNPGFTGANVNDKFCFEVGEGEGDSDSVLCRNLLGNPRKSSIPDEHLVKLLFTIGEGAMG